MISRSVQTRYEESPKTSQEEKRKQLEKARTGLEQAVLGLSEYVKGMSKTDLGFLQEKNQKILKERSNGLSSIEVSVPKSLHVPEKPVLFLDFGSVDQKDVHPAPDPELLLAKTATIWGRMNGVTILANGDPEDDEDSVDSLDELAEETFYENFRSSTPQIPNEVSVVTPGFVGLL
jgi:hypothetical protein